MPGPTYVLSEVHRLVSEGAWHATWEAIAHAVALEFDAEKDISTCVLALDEADFYKTMPSIKKPGTFQDVYKTTYLGKKVYIKLAVAVSASGKQAAVIQFKKDQSI